LEWYLVEEFADFGDQEMEYGFGSCVLFMGIGTFCVVAFCIIVVSFGLFSGSKHRQL